MAKLLMIGNATLDIIVSMDAFPIEDKKHLALGQTFRRGGNASNTSEVLTQLGHDVSLVAPLADDTASETIRHSLQQRSVDLSYCPTHQNSTSPTSYILINEKSKTRTIVHCRDLTELSYDEFNTIPLSSYDLIHFEGRNIPAVQSMMKTAGQIAGLKISCEIEKPRDDIKSLIPYADLVIFSNSYYRHTNSATMEDFFHYMRTFSDKAVLVCSRGAKGAYGQLPNQCVQHSPAFDFGPVVDTVGAGDTFNAALLASFSISQSLQLILKNACLLASKKVCQHGFDGLNSFDLSPLGER